MDNELYLIHEDDYLRHIDHKLEMYKLLLELVQALREDLAEGETARAVRDLCSYEQQAQAVHPGADGRLSGNSRPGGPAR